MNDRVLTATGTSTINGESNLTFDGDALYVQNTQATGLQLNVRQGAGGTGDASIRFDIPGPVYWTIGIDNSNSDKFIISNNSGLGTNDYIQLGGNSITFSQTVAGFTMGGELNMDGNDINLNNGNITNANEINASIINAGEKNFDIPHPTKPGWRLRYSVLEGPERGVYVRGKVQGDGIINLPDYWSSLIYEDSITVELTPIGKACTHYVKDANSSKIEVGCGCGDVNAYYVVFAERQASEPVWVEYQVVQ